MWYRSLNIIALSIVTGCSVPLFKSQPAVPSVEQFQKQDVFKEALTHDRASVLANHLAQQVIVDQETAEHVSQLDSIRYILIRRAENLMADGKFEEAEKYVKSANLVLRQILIYLRGKHAENTKKEESDKSFHSF